MDYELKNPLTPGLSVTEQLLVSRGINQSDVSHYLNPTDADVFPPTLLKNMERGAKMLVSHIAKKDKVFVQIDSDADGYTSAAALINYLNMLFPNFAQSNISYRPHDSKQHGLISELIPEGVKLVIAPDSSSNDYDVHKLLHENGIDVLVIDHHQAEVESEYACVINNQLCNYPNKNLSGVGIVYKFCCYLDSLLGANYANNIIDLVALGNIADMVDLRNFETRYLITSGFNNIRNPYFKAMVAAHAFQLKDGITPTGIAFSVAPYINAVTRSGTMQEKIILFESMLDFRGYEQIPSTKRGCSGQWETRVEQACRNCNNIKTRQNNARDTSLEIIEQMIEKQNLLEDKVLIIQLDSNKKADKNLTGLIATQLANKYQRPTLILNQTVHIDSHNNEIIEWEGSGRGYDLSALKDFRQFLIDSNLIQYAEGHPNAFGAGILDADIQELKKYCNEVLKDFDFSPNYKVDFIFTPNDIQGHYVLDIGKLDYIWGQGLPEPLVMIKELNVTKDNLTLLESKRNGYVLKINVPSQSGDICLIKFRSSKEEYENLYSQLGCVTINIIGKCQVNSFNGYENPQIEIVDYEILRRTAYYF